MTREDRGHFAKKHPPDLKVKPEIAKAVKEKVSEGEISCAAAFKIVSDMGVLPDEVGFTIDSLEIKINKCQIGLYGYGPGKRSIKPMDNVPGGLVEAIRESMTDSRLSCEAAWELAERFDIGKMDVASACEAMKIKISSCQLGAF